MGLNLQVPIELLDVGIESLSTGDYTDPKNLTKFDLSNYDGDPVVYFEIVVQNIDSSARNVYLVDGYGTVMATISVPVGALSRDTRLRSEAWTPGEGDIIYQVKIDQTTADGDVEVHTARIIVTQTDAIKTRIQIPLCNEWDYVASNNVNSTVDETLTPAGYVQLQPQKYLLWTRDDDLYGGTIDGWVLEAVLRNTGGTAQRWCWAALFNATDGAKIAKSEVATSLGDPTWLRSEVWTNTTDPDDPYYDAAWHDGDSYELRIQYTKGLIAGDELQKLYRACLYLQVSNISACDVIWRLGKASSALNNRDESRVLFDPDLYPTATSLFLDTIYYRSGSAGKTATYLIDTGTQTYGVNGAHSVDTNCYAGAESWTKAAVFDEAIVPPHQHNLAYNWYIQTAGWTHSAVLLHVRFPLVSTMVPSSVLEVPIELTDRLLRTTTSANDYLKTKVALDTGDFNGDLTVFFEVMATIGSGTPPPFNATLKDNAGAVVATNFVCHPGMFRIAFEPSAGLDYYYVALDAVASGYWHICARLIVRQSQSTVQVTRTRVYVPLIEEQTGSASSSTTAGCATRNSSTYGLGTGLTFPAHHTIYVRDDGISYDIASGNAIRFEVVMAAGGASETAWAVLYNKTDDAAVTGSEVSVVGTTPTYCMAEFAADAANFANNKEFEVRVKRTGGSTNMTLHAARLSLLLDPMRNCDVWWRVGHVAAAAVAQWVQDQALIDARAFAGRQDYYHEATGYVQAAGGDYDNKVFDIIEYVDSTDAVLNFNSTTRSRKRSDAITIPSDGYAYWGFGITINAGAPFGSSFIVLQGKAVPLPRDWWPEFIHMIRMHQIAKPAAAAVR